MAPDILVSEDHKHTWRQYLVITDARVACVEMIPAVLAGWKLHRVWVQTEDHKGYSQSAIARGYLESQYGHQYASAWSLVPSGSLGTFETRLIAVAAAGKLPSDGES